MKIERAAGPLKKKIKAAPADSGEKQAGLDALSRLRKRRAALWSGVGLTALAGVDAAFFSTALGALHVTALPLALTVDAWLAIGAITAGSIGAWATHREKKSIKNALKSEAGLKTLEKKRKITKRKGNRRGLRYGVVEGTWYSTPIQTTHGVRTAHGSRSADGVLVRFNTEKAGGLVTSRRLGPNYKFDGHPFGEHPVEGESYNALGTTREAQTLQFIKDRYTRFGLKDKLEKRAFIDRWGWRPGQNVGNPYRRAIVGFVEPETKSGSSYVVRADGRTATIYKTGTNFANDPTDFVKYTGWRWWRRDKDGNYIHSRMRSLWKRNPDKMQRLAMRAIVTGKAFWRGSYEGTPVFNRVAGFWRNSAGRLYTPDSIDTNNQVRGLAETRGVQAGVDKYLTEQAAAQLATAQRAEVDRVAAEAAQARATAEQVLPPMTGEFQYVKTTLVPTVTTIADAGTHFVGNDSYVIGIPTVEGVRVTEDGDFKTREKTVTSEVSIFAGGTHPEPGTPAERAVRTIKIINSDTGEVTGLEVIVFSLRPEPDAAGSSYDVTTFTYNRAGVLEPNAGGQHTTAQLKQLTEELASLQPQGAVPSGQASASGQVQA